jgi:CRISPR/Cas system CMR subunit Cmr6 (Cas7 group RAMP superfamily)
MTNQQPVIVKQERTVCGKCTQMDALLDREREKANQYKEMYENELQNKKDTAQYYESKLHALLRDKDILVNKYEQKIKSMAQSSMPIVSKSSDSSTSLGLTLNDLPRSPDQRPVRRLPPAPQKSPAKSSSS